MKIDISLFPSAPLELDLVERPKQAVPEDHHQKGDIPVGRSSHTFTKISDDEIFLCSGLHVPSVERRFIKSTPGMFSSNKNNSLNSDPKLIFVEKLWCYIIL